MSDLVLVDARNFRARIVLGALALVVVILAWLAIRWQLGNMLATLTTPSVPNAARIAEAAAIWAPFDPAPARLRAATATEPTAALQFFEHTVRLSPNDYNWRINFARALEQDGQIERAGLQFNKAVELAPSYASPLWHRGNFYLRQNRADQAFADFAKSAEHNTSYRDQVFSLAWEYFNKDASQLEKLAGEKTEGKARLAYFLAVRGRAADAVTAWNRLDEAEKAANRVIAKDIAHGFFLQKHFPEALEFGRHAGIDPESRVEAVTNPSFEKTIGDTDDSRFGWLIMRIDPKFEAVPDARIKREGERSLRILFRGYSRPALANVVQTVVVDPGRRYRLIFWLRTESLRSAGNPQIEIVNARDDSPIVRSAPFSGGTNDWQQVSVEFTTPETCNAINIRTARAYCGEECPIFGTLWYDDFELKLL